MHQHSSIFGPQLSIVCSYRRRPSFSLPDLPSGDLVFPCLPTAGESLRDLPVPGVIVEGLEPLWAGLLPLGLITAGLFIPGPVAPRFITPGPIGLRSIGFANPP